MSEIAVSTAEHDAIVSGLEEYLEDWDQTEAGYYARFKKDDDYVLVTREHGVPENGQFVLRMTVHGRGIETWGDTAEQVNRTIRANWIGEDASHE